MYIICLYIILFAKLINKYNKVTLFILIYYKLCNKCEKAFCYQQTNT